MADSNCAHVESCSSNSRHALSEKRRGSILVGQRSLDLMTEHTPGDKGPRFAIFIIRQYRRWGYFVAEHDWKFVLVCLVISLFGLIKVFLTPQQNDITGYTPYGARAIEEYTRYQEFFSEDGPGVAAYIFVLAKDGGNMLRESHLKETVDVLNMATENIALYNPNTNKSKSFSQFCQGFCQANEPIRQFYNGFRVQMEGVNKGEKLNGRIDLSYPITKIFGRTITLQQSFFGITFYEGGVAPSSAASFNLTEALLAANETSTDSIQLDAEEEESSTTTTKPSKTQSSATTLRAALSTTTTASKTHNLTTKKTLNFTTTTEKSPPKTLISNTTVVKVVNNFTSEKPQNPNANENEVSPKRKGRDLNVEQEHILTNVTNMKEVKMLVLQFRAEHQEQWTKSIVKRYELDMVEKFEREYTSKNLKLYVLSQSYAEAEMVRAGVSLLPYLTVGFTIMALCAIFSVVIRAIYMQQHSPPKILLAIAACCLPFMSCATALGIMFQFGMRFASILCVIPFLVLSIGVDSSYLMIHEWQREIKHCRNNPNRKNANVGYRISRVLSEVGPAVLISTLTNIFADAMGTFTSSPEITLLCLGNLASMMVAFFYQITCYAGLMSLVGRYEIATERKEWKFMQESLRSTYGVEMANGKSPLTRQESKFIENTKHYMSKTMLVYVNFMLKGVALLVIFVYFIYLALSIWGITRININLSTQKLFRADSPLLSLDKLRVDYQLPHFTMATVFVSNPGNLSDPTRLKRMNDFVREMEKINGSWGPVGTQYFVRISGDIEPPEETGETDSPSLSLTTETPNGPFDDSDLTAFVSWPEDKHWNGFIKLDNKTGSLRRFFFTTAYQGKHLSVWTERGKLLSEWRFIVDKYAKDFNASVFHEDAVFLDLIDNMPNDTWQSVLGTLIAMAVICFLFLNSLFTVIMASTSVLSIVAGILGILSWWSIDLDPITMAAMIISIGFSVDIPAHVSYHYYQASVRELNATPQIKLVNCLSSVAFPALQAALSTTLCVCSLLFVKLYMAEVFVKTMVLCVVLCNLHGLLFLPAFLIVFDDLVRLLRRFPRRKRRVATAGAKKNAKPPPAGRISEEGSIQESIKKKDGGSHDEKSVSPNRNGWLSRRRSATPVAQSTIPDRPALGKHFADDTADTTFTQQNSATDSQTGTTTVSTPIHDSPPQTTNKSSRGGESAKTRLKNGHHDLLDGQQERRRVPTNTKNRNDRYYTNL